MGSTAGTESPGLWPPALIVHPDGSQESLPGFQGTVMGSSLLLLGSGVGLPPLRPGHVFPLSSLIQQDQALGLK